MGLRAAWRDDYRPNLAESHYIADVIARRRVAVPRTAAACDLVQKALDGKLGFLPKPARERLELNQVALGAALNDGEELSEASAQELVEFIAEHTS